MARRRTNCSTPAKPSERIACRIRSVLTSPTFRTTIVGHCGASQSCLATRCPRRTHRHMELRSWSSSDAGSRTSARWPHASRSCSCPYPPPARPARPIIEKIGVWRELLPEVDVRLLLAAVAGKQFADRIGGTPVAARPQTATCVNRWTCRPRRPLCCSESTDCSPAARWLGTDDVEAFIDDIYESLHGQRPPVTSTVPDQRG